jgi:hypothetical protein
VEDIRTRLGNRTGSKETTECEITELEELAAQDDLVDASVASSGETEEGEEAGAAREVGQATASSSATKVGDKRKPASDSQDNLPRLKKQRQAWKAIPYRSRRQRASNSKQLTTVYLPFKDNHADLVVPLYCWGTVQDIKNFLSKVSRIYGEQPLFLYTKPIAFSSSREKRQLKHFEQSQQRDTFKSWTRQSLKGATCLIGLLTTWTDGWVGRTGGDFKNAPWHAWAAVLKVDEKQPWRACYYIVL